MGVKDLWSILEPVREKRSLESLQGKTVAVDLGIWVCEMQAAIRNPTVLKPYLRNLFFRITALLQRQIKVIVVADGKPPELKRAAMLERQKSRYNKNGNVIVKSGGGGAAVGRSKFTGHLRECIELLHLMGVSVLESDGEAEASCASMNADGVVDAVITDDSDAFLYGARLVIRNFNLEGKEPEADFYSMDVIERRSGLSRNKLIALGVFLGSDYCSAGVPGVGKETALKYLNYFGEEDDELVLSYLKSWVSTGFRGDAALLRKMSTAESVGFEKLDKTLRTKAATAKELVIDAVIEEFLQERKIKVAIDWRVPDLAKLEAFFTRHLNWVSNYTVAKVVPLITLWQLLQDGKANGITANRIVKTRLRNGRTMYEVQWKRLPCDVWTVDEDYYVTVEKKELVEKALRHLVDDYLLEKKSKTKRPASRKTKTKPQVPSAIASISSETKENEEIIDLSETLERSLLLFDQDDDQETIDEKTKDSKIGQEPEQQRIYSFFKKAEPEAKKENEKREKNVEASPLPLWKRLALKKEDNNFLKESNFLM